MKNLFVIILCLLASLSLQAQDALRGSIKEQATNLPLLGATVSITAKQEGARPMYTTSDQNGSFTFKRSPKGEHTLTISFVGFETYRKHYRELPQNGKLGTFYLKEESIQLGEVVAQGRDTRATQKGDTLEYNASAFKTAQGSTTEDLITKMPGIIVDGGSVEAQGEQIKRVFVDGKAFFEGDPMLALRSLPADLVQSIEVFDKQSDDAQFAGYDDGNTEKSINIRTRNPNMVKQFGRGAVGYGTDNRYQINGNYNYFKGDRRISILAMSNNVNQQNFSQEDLAGVMQGNSRRGPRGGGAKGSGKSSNSMLSNVAGITHTTGLGINYVDKWGKKLSVQGSYFFNYSENEVNTSTDRTYYDTIPFARNYVQQYQANSRNINHRFNLKMDYAINERNAIAFMPSFSIQDNELHSLNEAQTLSGNQKINDSKILNHNETQAYNLRGTLQYRHRFEKPGRMFSISVTGSKFRNHADQLNSSVSQFFEPTGPRLDSINLSKDNTRENYSTQGMLLYSEPLGEKSGLTFNYRINYNQSDADNYTYARSPEQEQLAMMLDTTLSNVYNSDYLTQTAGAGFRHFDKEKGVMLFAMLNYEHASLKGSQFFPAASQTDKQFSSLLPMVRLEYKINPTNSLRFMLRGYSSEPSISQLQNLIDNSNPLLVSGGNPELDQERNYMFSTRYTLTSKKGYTFFAMIGGSMAQDYVGNNIQIITAPTEVAPGIILNEGTQFTTPVNLSGSWSSNAMVTFGMPIDFLKSNLNLTANLRYSELPGLYNGTKLMTKDYGITPGAILSSNISDKLDFTLSYFGRLNYFKNSSESQQENDYINQTANAKINWEFWKGFNLETSLAYENYTGLSSGYNEDYFVWNASIGKRFLRSKRLEVKVSAFDILKQNQSIRREISNSYYQDVTSNVLKPYYMVSLVYDLRLFPMKKGKSEEEHPHFMGPRGMGGPPPGGGMGGPPPGAF